MLMGILEKEWDTKTTSIIRSPNPSLSEMLTDLSYPVSHVLSFQISIPLTPQALILYALLTGLNQKVQAPTPSLWASLPVSELQPRRVLRTLGWSLVVPDVSDCLMDPTRSPFLLVVFPVKSQHSHLGTTKVKNRKTNMMEPSDQSLLSEKRAIELKQASV